ncbi:MAG: DUF1249 domain-containing protein [Pseudoalteromonas sp.]|uniref:DUF1249 domain-containing protein n=1 Tax=unclassified Pseudoalteromonas TaxID=194690 RepID=UPI003F9ABD1D
MAVSTVQQRYIQSLPKYLTLCEYNYLRALKLLPKQHEVGCSRKVLLGSNQFQVTIESTAKYTMDIAITQQSGMLQGIAPLFLTVRLYHDAKVAEIIHHDYHQRIKPSYAYPNPNMHQKDEKYQLNAFLHDWLTACLENGRAELNWDVKNGLV